MSKQQCQLMIIKKKDVPQWVEDLVEEKSYHLLWEQIWRFRTALKTKTAFYNISAENEHIAKMMLFGLAFQDGHSLNDSLSFMLVQEEIVRLDD
jgi:hypothetical protein